MIWLELHLRGRRELPVAYRMADEADAETIHHFDEPWWEHGPVVRVRVDEGLAAALQERFEYVVWDATPDERLYGDQWPWIAEFFEAASRVCLVDGEGEIGRHRDLKLIHCALNAWGYSALDEAAFATEFARNRWMIERRYAGGSLFRRLCRAFVSFGRIRNRQGVVS